MMIWIDLINNLVCILLKSRCKDNNLVVLGHQIDELDATWSN